MHNRKYELKQMQRDKLSALMDIVLLEIIVIYLQIIILVQLIKITWVIQQSASILLCFYQLTFTFYIRPDYGRILVYIFKNLKFMWLTEILLSIYSPTYLHNSDTLQSAALLSAAKIIAARTRSWKCSKKFTASFYILPCLLSCFLLDLWIVIEMGAA